MKGKLPFWLKIYLTLQSLVQQSLSLKVFSEHITCALKQNHLSLTLLMM